MTSTWDQDLPSPWLRGAAAALLAVWVGCSAPTPEQELSAALQQARAAAGDSAQARQAIGLLEGFVGAHPQDRGVPEALIQVAILRQQQGDVVAAVRDYERILAQHPESAVAAKAQFMVAFINEEHLRDYDAARRAYQAVVDNHPDSELAAQAQLLLAHVGQAPDEWVPSFRDIADTADTADGGR